ncbi:glycine betaine ABC transporter substrate-binding protein [Paenibacillus sp. J5C_2022]|uniref:glycine betaine ABC transporter substrate-binding protein n=1 Tax=Paenibacillus sp. J5C2022 TaxID=2977129 RepID=UPI0021D357C8|nr:glycine betaine ABC transporter substrate-binding protein [Paenibacillus sp. J5C2022]MCU6711988.1 glycine betaine ABC transporter substrate-binding protein [Paenibacillus sp. J5C2022]
MKKAAWLLSVAMVVGLLSGCGGNNGGSDNGGASNGGDKGGDKEKKEITLAYVAWDSEIASTNVVKEVLESKMGYTVEMLQVDAGPMWTGVADGSADAMVAAWLPTTHETYLSENEGKLEDLGPNLNGTKLGLVVPSYMDINSIEDLNDEVGKSLDYTITGIEPGAGLMMKTEKVIEDYGLSDWKLLDSSSAAMAQALEKAYEDEKPIIVTGWTPHWKFAKMDLKYLEDPKGIYGADEQIHTIVRNGLKEDDAEAYAFLDAFNWTPDDMATVMVDIVEGQSAEEAAKAWVEANADKVDAWLK